MARTGLTWKLKLDDAMSGAAQKIATKLGQVRGALEGLDEAKVTGPTAATTNAEQVAAKIADDRAARVQKAMQAESAASAKFTEQESARAYRAADQIATAQEKGQERVQAARDRIRAAEEKYAAGSSRMTAKQAERQKAAIVQAKSELQTEITKIERETQDKVDAIRTKAQRASADATSKFEARQQRSRERSQAVEARRSASETKKARKAIEAEERKIQRAAAKTKKAARPQQDDGEGFFAQLAGGFGQFVVVAQAAFDIAARVIGAIVSAVGPMITKAMELQKFAQSTKYAFGQLLGGGAAADDAWNRAQEIAIKTGQSIQDVAGAMNKMVAQGFGLAETEELVKRFADLKAMNPAADIDGIARAMSQIKATGKLQGDELNELNNAGLASDKVYAQLEKRLGKNREEVLKLKEAGKISAEDALAAIKAALAEQTGKAAGAVAEEAASKTLGGAIGRLQAQIDKMLSSESPAFATLARAINMVVEMLAGGKFSGALSSLTGLFGSLAGLAERFVIAISQGGADDVLGQMGAGLSRISKAIDGITVEDIIGGLKSLADSIRFVVELWQAFWTLGAPARDMASGVLAVVGAIGQLVIWIGRAVTELSSMIGSIEATTAKLTGGLTGAFTSSGSALGTSFVSGIVEAISNGASAMAEAARSAASSAVDAAMDAIGDIELPSFGGTVPGGGMMGDSMMMGAAAGRDMRSGDTNRTFSPTVNINVSGGASNTGGMVSAIGDALKSLNNSFA